MSSAAADRSSRLRSENPDQNEEGPARGKADGRCIPVGRYRAGPSGYLFLLLLLVLVVVFLVCPGIASTTAGARTRQSGFGPTAIEASKGVRRAGIPFKSHRNSTPPRCRSYPMPRSAPRFRLHPSKHGPAASTISNDLDPWRFPIPNRMTAGTGRFRHRSDRGAPHVFVLDLSRRPRSRFMLSGAVHGIKSNVTVVR